MSDIITKATSSYFHVVNVEAFKEWCNGYGLQSAAQTDEPDSMVCMWDESGRGWPTHKLDEDGNECEEIPFVKELSNHIQDSDSVVLKTINYSGYNNLHGEAVVATRNNGYIRMSLDDIYSRVERVFAGKLIEKI